MQNNHACLVCGKPVPADGLICAACAEVLDGKEVRIEYQIDQTLIPSSIFSQRMLVFFQEFFVRPEIKKAYEAYEEGLCDEPSQSLE